MDTKIQSKRITLFYKKKTPAFPSIFFKCNLYPYPFPGIVEPVATGQAAKDYLSKAVNPTLLKGLTDLAKKKPEDPVVSTFHINFIILDRALMIG